MDKREHILVALKAAIVDAVGPDVYVARNEIEISEKKYPAVAILDADERADDSARNRNRPASSPNLVGMTPEIYILVGDRVQNIGTRLNELRALIVKGVLTDPTLASLCHSGDIFYEGFATGLGSGRQVAGSAGVSFTFTYVLKPTAL